MVGCALWKEYERGKIRIGREFGSYNCPQVWTLRRFRDYELSRTVYGRAFIKCYYAVSPTIVKIFGERNWFQKIWKEILDKKILKLNEKGYDNTPYNDK